MEDSSESGGEKFEQLVDTGKWRTVGAYFQLRVQLLMPGKAIYSPSEVGTRALALLKRVSLLHKAFGTRGLPFHPPLRVDASCLIRNISPCSRNYCFATRRRWWTRPRTSST